MKAYAVYSDDGGHTWQYGDTAPANTGEHANETQMAELDDGRLMLNARSFKDNKCRKTAFSSDGGVSWTALQDIPDLVEPECQASIIALPTNTNATNQSRNNATTLLYCGPNNPLHRVNGELKVSNDLGQSWQKLATIYPGSFGYSSIGQLNDKHIGVLFERDEYQAISFVKCVLD